MNHHTIIKDGRVNNHQVFLTCRGESNKKLVDNFHRPFENIKTLTIALAPFDESIKLEPRTNKNKTSEGVPFYFLRIEEPDKDILRTMVESILKEARDNGVDILIFPELTIDNDLLSEICNQLKSLNEPDKIKLIVAGSFHEGSDEGGYVNKSTMLNGRGDVVWHYRKQARFKLTSQAIDKSPNKEEIRKIFNLEPDDHLIEEIHTNHPMVFMDTPIGRMSTLICLDFIHNTISDVLSRVPCDYFWVPAMTPLIDYFENDARDFGMKELILSACCNSRGCCKMINGNNEEKSFLFAPRIKIEDMETKNKEPGAAGSLLKIFKLDKKKL